MKEQIKPSYYGKEHSEDLLSLFEQDIISSRLSSFESFCLMNSIKYLVRYKSKNGINDLEKANEYLNRLLAYQKRDIDLSLKKNRLKSIQRFNQWYHHQDGYSMKIDQIIQHLISYSYIFDYQEVIQAQEQIKELIK